MVAASLLTFVLATRAVGLDPASMGQVHARAFVGDLSRQNFISLQGRLIQVSGSKTEQAFRCRLSDGARKRAVLFQARCRRVPHGLRWSYTIFNSEKDLTICSVTFPTVENVRLSSSWEGEKIVWPSLCQGALIDDLTSQEAFVRQAKKACKGIPHLHGRYQGDLCLPFFVQIGGRGSFGIMVLDPTHEVVSLDGFRSDSGMRYQVTVYPKVPPGQRWHFGEIEVFTSPVADWHIHADRYRRWLIDQGFRRPQPDCCDVATLVYGRWDGLIVEEVMRWAEAFDVRDVGFWQQLFGHGDQYYPCYFPPPGIGVEGMRAKLMKLRQAGLSPYFYTNYYLLSPLQTAEDAQRWSQKHPKQYPAWLAKGDKGYAEAVRQFWSQGYEFAGPWLVDPAGILKIRVRRVDFKWGEYPVYFWHKRPFYAACVATPQWRKLFRDTARLHASMGARGIYMDQLAAMYPELCSAKGHGHDNDSFGFWNRAALALVRLVKDTGREIEPRFFIEAEGAADLYARYVDRFFCYCGRMPKLAYPELLHYTVPWVRADVGFPPLRDPAETLRLIQRVFLVGAIFRLAGGGPTGPFDPQAPVFTGDAARLLKAAIRARRRLRPLFDGGRYMDDVGIQARGCSDARWFHSSRGVLIVAVADSDGAEVTLAGPPPVDVGRAWALDWLSGKRRPAAVARVRGALRVTKLSKGINLLIIPASSKAR